MPCAIKICGITNSDTANYCAQAGADYIGLVFVESSPRYVTVNQAKEIAKAAHDAGIIPVAVFAEANIEEIDFMLNATGIHMVQRSGQMGQYDLLDSPHPGTGTKLDWHAIKQPDRPFFLAGGLNPDNVAEAIRLVQPHGVDVSSGVEKSPGKKCKRLIKKFIRAVREVDNA